MKKHFHQIFLSNFPQEKQELFLTVWRQIDGQLKTNPNLDIANEIKTQIEKIENENLQNQISQEEKQAKQELSTLLFTKLTTTDLPNVQNIINSKKHKEEIKKRIKFSKTLSSKL